MQRNHRLIHALSFICLFFFPSSLPLLIFSPFPHRHLIYCIWPMSLGICLFEKYIVFWTCVHFRSLFIPYFFTAFKSYPCYYTYLKPIASNCYLFIPQNAFTRHGLLIHSPNDGYLGCLHSLLTQTTLIHVPPWTWIWVALRHKTRRR